MSVEHSVELGTALFIAGQSLLIASYEMKHWRRGFLGAFGLMVSMVAGFVVAMGVGSA